MRSILPLAVLVLLGTASCAQHANREARAPLTERERDSLIARSNLPGGFVVGRAMAVSDRAGQAAARQDSLVRQQTDEP